MMFSWRTNYDQGKRRCSRRTPTVHGGAAKSGTPAAEMPEIRDVLRQPTSGVVTTDPEKVLALTRAIFNSPRRPPQ